MAAVVSVSASVCTSQPEDGVSLPVWPTFLDTSTCAQIVPSSLPGRECMHCGRALDALQPLPTAVAEQSRGVYSVRGVYCCSQCAIAAAHDVSVSSKGFPQARRLTCALLTSFFGIPNTASALGPAMPREVLYRFGGWMTLEEFHSASSVGKVVSVTPIPMAPHVDVMHVRRWLARFENGARRHYAPFEREGDSVAEQGRVGHVFAHFVATRPCAASRERARRNVAILSSPSSPLASLAEAARGVGAFGVGARQKRDEIVAASVEACLSRTPLPPRSADGLQKRVEEELGALVRRLFATDGGDHEAAVIRRVARVLLGEEEGWEQLPPPREEEGEAGASASSPFDPLRSVVTVDRVSCWMRGMRPENGLVVCGLRRPPGEKCVRAWPLGTTPEAPAWDGLFESVAKEVPPGAANSEEKIMEAAKKRIKTKTTKRASTTEQKLTDASRKMLGALGIGEA